jgi:hypothetical protein
VGSTCQREGREKTSQAKGATQWKKCIPKNVPRALRPTGLGEKRRPVGRGGPALGELGLLGQIPGEDSIEN